MAKQPAPLPPARKRKASDLIVTLDEFASIYGVTPETMRKHLSMAPVDAAWLIERGGRGRGYKIAAGGAVAWYQSRSAGGDDVDARSAALAELRMQMLGDAGDDEGLGFTGKQRYEEYKAGEAELAYRQAIGELCRIAEVAAVTVNAVIELRRGLQGVGPTIRRKFNLDREVETAIEELIAEKLAALIKTLDVDVAGVAE